MVPIKNESDIEKMRVTCRIAARVLDEMIKKIAPGISTYELDQIGKELIHSFDAKSACHNYRSGKKRFPAYTCLSVNEEVVHGIGRKDRILQPGDSITVDVCLSYNGFIGDNARTVIVGPCGKDMRYLVDSTEQALWEGIKKAVPKNKVSDISGAIEDFIQARDLSIVRDFVGHGIGRTLHEEPKVPNFRCKSMHNPRLEPGMTLAIEPMINLGRHEVQIARDGWTAVTRDRLPSAHFEHTILITKNDPEVLTDLAAS